MNGEQTTDGSCVRLFVKFVQHERLHGKRKNRLRLFFGVHRSKSQEMDTIIVSDIQSGDTGEVLSESSIEATALDSIPDASKSEHCQT